jgi:hypothetical protein
MSYRMITLETDRESAYPPEFMDSLREHQDQGWNLILIAWDGDNPVVLFQKPI